MAIFNRKPLAKHVAILAFLAVSSTFVVVFMIMTFAYMNAHMRPPSLSHNPMRSSNWTDGQLRVSFRHAEWLVILAHS